MYFLAFDQALANTGWSLIELTTQPILINYGVIKTNSKDDLIVRLFDLENNISTLVNHYQPTCIFMEKVHCPRNSPFAWPTLLVVESLLKLWFFKNNFTYISLDSKVNIKTSWRHILNLKTSDKKETKALFNNLKINDHIADSIAINLAGLIASGYLKNDDLNDIPSYINCLNQNTKKVIII